jgi:hypothetical protein
MSRMSTTTRVPTCVTLPPDLLARVDRIAEADERSRSFVVARALQTYCDQIEIPSAARVSVPRPVVRVAALACEANAPAGDGLDLSPPPALSYPATLHVAALRRSAAVQDERAETGRQHRERVMQNTTEALKGSTTE